MSEPLNTGTLGIDVCIPVGRGQRELIIGDRSVGKSSICMDAFLNLRYEKVLLVNIMIAQKTVSIIPAFVGLVTRGVTYGLAFIVASARDSAALQLISVYSGTSLAEYFMYRHSAPAWSVTMIY